ncbi:MAG: hypothetical protein GXY55_16245 [Phycisphaerae bacterium]|nr:hypothetical protein [Phycisphaerae bacterium]
MKRSLPSVIAGSVLAIVLMLYMVMFQVRFSEVAVVRTFGQIKRVVEEPGLYWKWPWPIQKVDTYDHRIQTTSTTGEETPTRDGKNVIVATTVCWRIADPYRFSVRCRTMKEAENLIKIRVRNDQKTVIGNYDFANFVSTDPNELKYDAIESEIASEIAGIAQELYGVKIERVAIESLSLPQRITETVIEAMKKDREALAQRYTSEGESQAKQIKDTAESIAGTIKTFAQRKAAEIVAEGQRRAVEQNKVFRQDEELATFLLQVENIPQILGNRATVVLDQPLIVEPLKEGATTRPAGSAGGRAAVLAPVITEAR